MVRDHRNALVVAAVTLLAAGFVVLLWRGAPSLDVGRLRLLTPVQRESAIDAIRGRLLQLAAGIVLTAGLVYTGLTFRLNRESHVTDRYTKAIDQLGSDRLDVRLGAIYALERIMIDSARDHPTIVEVLAAFVRVHAPLNTEDPDGDAPGARVGHTPTDVQAALTVLGRRPPGRVERGRLDLHDTMLPRVYLPRANLVGANLLHADLARANLFRADLAAASLSRANLAEADMRYASLEGAYLDAADLTSADLVGANLARTWFKKACLVRADLSLSNLADARLIDADLTEADLRRTRIDVEDLKEQTVYLDRTKLPPGAAAGTGEPPN
jgi:hypothetical protein